MQKYKTFTAQITHFWAAMRLSDYDELINEIRPCKSEFPIDFNRGILENITSESGKDRELLNKCIFYLNLTSLKSLYPPQNSPSFPFIRSYLPLPPLGLHSLTFNNYNVISPHCKTCPPLSFSFLNHTI